MKTMQDPVTKLVLPEKFIDAKTALKANINKLVTKAADSVKIRENFFLVLHAKFDSVETDKFIVSQIVASIKIPPFTSNQMTFYVSPSKGFIELLWMVPSCKKGEKLKVEFNEKGVAYLQAKGAMPS